MNAKDFIQMEKQVEQLVAFQTIMKGELAKEISEAKAALQTLQEGTDLVKSKQIFIKEQKEYQEYKIKTEQQLDAFETILQEKQKQLATLEETLKTKEVSLQAFQADLKAKEYALETAKYNFEQVIAQEKESLQRVKADLEVKLEKFQSRVDAVAAREASVEKKLAIIKGM